MTRTVSVFFRKDLTGYSEPGTCPRCARSVHVSRFGKPKAHRCPHRLQCTPGGEGCSKCKAARELPAAEKRCCDAAVALNEANESTHEEDIMNDLPWCEAHAEACAAGAELARLRGAT